METEIVSWCRANKGEHGIQKVQSILLPQSLYYLECGCIYWLDVENSKYKLLRSYIQKCMNCGKNLDKELVLYSPGKMYCANNCADGRSGTIEIYNHSLVPRFSTVYEVQWKLYNDTKKAERDAKIN